MGSGESRTRKVSFGVDDEDRVRILRGVKLSDDVLQRMKGVANIAPEKTATTPQKDPDASRTPSVDSQTKQTLPDSSQSYKQEEQRRFEEQQQFLKDELSKVAQKEAVIDELAKARSKEKLETRREAEKAKALTADELEVMAEKLQKKDSQLKALEAFYKAQIAQLEKRNQEEYEQSKDQFHQAASKTEEHVRPRNTEPVCTGLQAQILSCYRDNKDQTLRCSDLAKEYMKCIQAAKKNLMVNHG